MSLNRVDYLTIEQVDTLGEYIAHYGSRRHYNLMLEPVLKVERAEDKADTYVLRPGYLDKAVYYPCPLRILYVKLHQITQQQSGEGYTRKTTIEAQIDVYDKSLAKHVSYRLILSNSGSTVLDFMQCNRIFNLINLYVDADNPLEKLNLAVFTQYEPREDDRSTLLRAVNSLQFEFFENSRNVVGKDNYFWEEAEVRGITKDPYLQQIILNGLRKNCESLYVKDDHILLTFAHDRAYSPSFSRRKMESRPGGDTSIKDDIKFELAKNYDSRTHLLSKLKKE
ncbi:hypothetical protein [Hymenobacter latericoloratus]|uniref:Uncharacterized protein n=1 Tax=Hymenobacter latericoloratus TaxID=1411121 RepID=A0ABR6K3G8_9BACT|nr:hypothetical protein [Hymenobacter latericoloratus]MBB4603602.1 hypothetical protein [Hymenobacter latericoloratus]